MKQLMKKSPLMLLFSTLLILVACQSKCCDVSTVYIHKYGVTLTEKDWLNRGGNGQIVITKKDGTILTQNFIEHELEGKTTTTFPHSFTIATEELYQRGHLLSEIHHYTSGVPKEKFEFISDDETLITTWYENGNPRNFEKYQNGKLLSGEYYSNKNDIESTIDSGNGIKIDRNAFGEFVSKMEVIYGDVVTKTLYHPNGDPKQLIPYKNNKVDGTVKKYLVNGIPESFEEWQDGVRQGMTTIFQDGRIFSSIPYIAGKKTGVETIYRSDGVVVAEITWKNNLKHGISTTYIEDVARSEWYYKGKKVSKSDFERLPVPVGD